MAGAWRVNAHACSLPVQLDASQLVSAMFSMRARPLAPGDVLLIYSDGVTEAMNPARELFGEERLAALLKKYGTQSAQTLIDHIVEDAKRYAGKALPHDDMTLLVMKRLAKG